ncbi:uncharacterized protein METZ01_LOCUS5869 [marine metagenome]|uniref:Uncharacterized protein n=1 Tax=marine metagenome TaxID=408172 RepID=A0A381NEL2_9ZZZZ
MVLFDSCVEINIYAHGGMIALLVQFIATKESLY